MSSNKAQSDASSLPQIMILAAGDRKRFEGAQTLITSPSKPRYSEEAFHAWEPRTHPDRTVVRLASIISHLSGG